MSEMSEILDRIDPTLRRLAYKFQTEELDPEDVYQNMVLAIIEKAKKNPSFIAVRDGYSETERDHYIINFAAWIAKNHIQKSRVYRKYVSSIEASEAKTESDDAILDFVVDETEAKRPEKAIEHKESLDSIMQAIKALDEPNQMIVLMAFSGHTNKEIAAALHISAPAVSQRRNMIRQQVSSLMNQAAPMLPGIA